MAKKPTLTTVSSGYNSAAALNTDLQSLRNGSDNTLSLDGSTPNAMGADLDLNSNDILNVRSLFAESVTIDGTVITVGNVAIDDDSSLETGPALELDPTTGQLIIAETLRFVPPVSGAIGANGQATFDSPSNTEFRILKRGSDGVLRSATITLA